MPVQARETELTTAEWAVLALVAERPTHGYAIGRSLSPGGDVGSVWSLSRPLVYRALEKLERLGLVQTYRIEQGTAPERRLLAAVPSAKRRVRRWLDAPVPHIREVRSDLMLKLAMHHRRGSDPAKLLRAQHEVVGEQVAGLASRLSDAEGFERTLLRWRTETARATLRFLEETLAEISREKAPSRARSSSPPSKP
jgi:PadR family transcriptional regulator AphA